MMCSPSPIRFKIEPRDVPPSKAARRLHLSLEDFRLKLPELRKRGFPSPDPTTGNYYLPAIDQWMASRTALTLSNEPRNDEALINERIARL
jgi:hypothetical protein